VKLPLRFLAHRFKRLSTLLAAPAALLLSQGQAKAILTYNIFQSGPDVKVKASGSLNLPSTTLVNADCEPSAILSANAFICTGPKSTIPTFRISGPTFFNGSVTAFTTNRSGIATILCGNSAFSSSCPSFAIDPTYSSGPIVSEATFAGQTLGGLGFTTTGLIGTWTLDGTGDTIQLILGPPAADVPGPLPLFGAGAAFAWSRRLRRRIATPLITPPQA
jgi:hypothetical protein